MITRVPWISLLVAGLLLIGTGCARDDSAQLDNLMENLFAAASDAELAESMDALLAANPDPLVVAERLRTGPRSFPVQEPGWQVHEMACRDGNSRYFHVFIPDSYDPATPHPLLVSLHGSVMQAGYTIEQFLFRRVMWEAVAQRDGFIVLMPHGDRDAPWWSEASRQNTRDMLHWVKRTCNINENRVYLAGFSNGAAGAFWMAFHDPTPWAAFIPIYGAVSSAENGPYQCYPSNLNQRPVCASNGTSETYVRSAASLIAQLQAKGVSVFWALHPTAHNLIHAMAYERDRSSELMSVVERDPSRSTIAWKTAHEATGRCDWIEILSIHDDGSPTRVEDLNLSWESEAVHFGVGIEYRGTEEGFVVSGVEPGTIARTLGIKSGDKLVRIDNRSVRTQQEVSTAMETKRMGDPIEVEVRRGEEHLVLQGVLPEYPLVFRRELPTAAVYAHVDGNSIEIETQHVLALRILLSDRMFDLAQPIRVVCNGQSMYAEAVVPDLSFLLAQWAYDVDRQAVYVAAVEISPMPPN